MADYLRGRKNLILQGDITVGDLYYLRMGSRGVIRHRTFYS
jgi:hypothetical protein